MCGRMLEAFLASLSGFKASLIKRSFVTRQRNRTTNCDFYKGAKEKLIEWMKDERLYVLFITNTFNHNRVARMARLRKEFYNLNWDICFIKNKWLVRTDMFIDDFHKNVEPYQLYNLGSKVYLVSRTWNERFEWDNRIDELSDIEPLIEFF